MAGFFTFLCIFVRSTHCQLTILCQNGTRLIQARQVVIVATSSLLLLDCSCLHRDKMCQGVHSVTSRNVSGSALYVLIELN